MHYHGMLMHMRTTLNLDDSLPHKAAKLTGVKEKPSLVRLGLEALIAKESARRLANLGGGRETTSCDSEAAASQRRMILVDTSVWIEHLRAENDTFILIIIMLIVHPLFSDGR